MKNHKYSHLSSDITFIMFEYSMSEKMRDKPIAYGYFCVALVLRCKY